MAKQNRPIDLNHIKNEDKIKYEIAAELGLIDKIIEGGWKSLSAKETGRIGSLVRNKKKEQKSLNH